MDLVGVVGVVSGLVGDTGLIARDTGFTEENGLTGVAGAEVVKPSGILAGAGGEARVGTVRWF